jgi:penicillin-binding protein 2
MFRDEDNRSPMNSQFAVRVAVLGTVALIVFAAIFFRLWYLEVLSGDAYLQEANANRVREIKVQAPRGEIVDRNGHVLVGNRTTLSLQVRPDKLFHRAQDRNHELRKLADLADMAFPKVKREIKDQTTALPASPATLKEKVDQDLVLYLREHQEQFPGVTADQVYVRDYPEGRLGAHLFGYVSEINEDQLKEPAYDGIDPGDRIGATGLEAQYDSVLRGRNGATRVQVDALGEPRGKELSSVEPKAGDNLVLTLDEKIQRAGEQALLDWGGGLPGAFAVMNVDDGSILGMGSYPDFDPNTYTPPVSSKAIDSLNNDPEKPLLDRAIQSAYPTGSTFKLITATAGLEDGLITPTTPYNDTGSFDFAGRTWNNAGSFPNGVVDMTSALKVSSDVYFYSLGIDAERAYESDPDKQPIQDWAKQYGFGSLTGIDLPAEGAGLLPTPEWRDKLYEDAADPDSCSGTTRDYINCGETDRKWSVGDMMNLAVGQGDLGATPLQLAVAYAAMGNGGEIVRPHLAERAENAVGQTTQQFDPAPKREIEISDETRNTIMEGLHEAANDAGGTSAGVFGGYPVDIAGKTGTAEGPIGVEDQSWYAALAPGSATGTYDDPKYVVVVTIERGGFGADRAAPAVRDILNQIYKVHGGQIDDVTDSGGAD